MKFLNRVFIVFVSFMLFISPEAYAKINYQQKIDAVLAKTPGVIVLCYHEVGSYKSPARTPYDLDRENLESHLKFFKKEGYTCLSLDDYIAINKGEKPLPPKAVMITFDDGYESFYKTIFPMLKKYNVPAMMAIIGSWMDGASAGVKMTTWEQFREMEASGLVTVASHTYDLHKPVLINEYGENNAAVGSRLYRGSGIYETEEAYRERIAYDFAKAQEQFEKNMGHKSRGLVWPFGAHTDIAIELAKEAGFEATFILNDGLNPVGERSLERARRIIVYDNPDAGQIAGFIYSHLKKDNLPFRLVDVKISEVYDPNDIQQTNSNIDALITRLVYSNTWRVSLQIAEDTDDDGFMDKVYFYNKKAPLINDIFNHVAGRLGAEGIQVYAKVPVFNNGWLLNDKNESAGLLKEKVLFDKKTRQSLMETVDYLAALSPISGVYFSEDLSLEKEDLQGLYAQKAYERKFGRKFNEQVLLDEALKLEWDNWRRDEVVSLTHDLIGVVKAYRPEARSIRVISENAVLDKDVAQNSAQDYGKFIANYDYVMVKVQGFYDDEFDAIKSRIAKVADAAVIENAWQSTIFGLPAYYQKEQRWFKSHEIMAISKLIEQKGIRYFAYFPETLMYDDLWYFPNINVSPY